MKNKIKEKVLKEPVTEEEHKTFMDLFKDEIGHPTEIPSEFERMIAFSRCMSQKLKDKVEDLEYDLLAYRRPRGTSVMNVREDEKKKTLTEVGKVIDKIKIPKVTPLEVRAYVMALIEELKQKLGIK